MDYVHYWCISALFVYCEAIMAVKKNTDVLANRKIIRLKINAREIKGRPLLKSYNRILRRNHNKTTTNI
jgi:hypothetical protein